MITKRKLHQTPKNDNINENIIVKEYQNGLKVIAEETSVLFPFSVSISVISGSRDEHNVPNGTAHFLEHLVFRRTKRLKSKQIAKEFEKYGAIANAFTTKEYTSYFATANYKNLSKVFNLLYEVVLEPEFNQNDINKEKKIIIDEIVSAEEDPEDFITDKISQIQFQNENIANPIAGSIVSVNEINILHLNYYFEQNYDANNIIIAYAGPNINEFLSIIEKFKFHSKSKIKENQKLNLNKAITFENKSNITNQTHLLLSKINLDSSVELRTCYTLFNIMISEAMSSRLYQSLRESKAITYNIYSGVSNYTDFTEFYIYTSFDSKKKQKVLELLMKEFNKLIQKPFSKSELSIAKELLKTYSLIENEGTLNKINNLTRQIMLYNKIEYSTQTIEYIDNFSLEKVIDITKSTFDYDNWFKYILLPD